MKILQIFGAVVAVHLLAFIFIFASPGCQSGPRTIPTPDATAPVSPSGAPITFDAGSSAGMPVDTGSAQVTYSPALTAGHAAPTRPGSPAAAAITPAKAVADVAPVTTYTVGKGDSLWSIAKKNNLSVSELARANNLGTGATLQPGKKLIIPGKPGAAPKDLATTAPAEKAADKSPAAAARVSGESVKHTVQPGESLGIIARKYQVTTGELAAANSITDPSKVRAGQQLVIPGFKAVNAKGSTTTKAVAPATAPAADNAAATPAVKTPHFELTAPPAGQDLDAGLKNASTEVPTIKVEAPKADEQPPKQ
ncbi:MAG: LysM peptidoglycan-binding domain-containing protein [Opitutae bacterium]